MHKFLCFIHKKLGSVEDFSGIENPMGVETVFDAPHEFKMLLVEDNIKVGFLHQAYTMLSTNSPTILFTQFKNGSYGFR
jgi:hypothetical protein